MRVQVELDEDGELLIHALGCRTADPALALPLITTTVIAAIQRCRSGRPMPVADANAGGRLRERVRALEEDLVAARAAADRDEQVRTELRTRLVAAERREGALRVEHTALTEQLEQELAGWADKLRAAEETAGVHADRAEKLQQRLRTVAVERDQALGRAADAETALAQRPPVDVVEGQAVQRRVALALLDEDRPTDEVAALVGASPGLVRRWEQGR